MAVVLIVGLLRTRYVAAHVQPAQFNTIIMLAKLKDATHSIARHPSYAALISFCISMVAMSVYENVKQLLFPAITLWESHAITVVVTSLMVAGIAFVVARNTSEADAHLKNAEERLDLYNAVMTATMHCVGNAMNTFQLIQIEAEDGGVVSADTLKIIDRELSATKFFMKDLSLIEEPSPELVYQKLKQSLKVH